MFGSKDGVIFKIVKELFRFNEDQGNEGYFLEMKLSAFQIYFKNIFDLIDRKVKFLHFLSKKFFL